jgi:hypothetical protein
MATIEDVRRIALALPEVEERISGHNGGPAWQTRRGGIAWERGPRASDLEALNALGRTWPDGEIIGVRVDGLDTKQALLESYPDAFFTIPHFEGYPAVLVRLSAIALDQLAEVITDAWTLRVTKRVAAAWLAAHGVDD